MPDKKTNSQLLKNTATNTTLRFVPEKNDLRSEVDFYTFVVKKQGINRPSRVNY